MSLESVAAEEWPVFGALLDEVLDRPPVERFAFVHTLSGERARYRDALLALLSRSAALETGSFLGTLPRLDVATGFANPVAGDRVGPYRLVGLLGQGGMGEVWRAERADGAFVRTVALKLPRIAWDRDVASRVARERDILAALEHPGIARLYDAGLDDRGRPYLAMELVDGQPLDVHASQRRLGVPERLDLLLQAAEAVAYANSQLVVHRDLKPSNILVRPDGRVCLLDFGIARLLDGDSARESDLTRAAGRALTPDYASPEQIAGAPIGTGTDVYSLGVVAFELLTSVKPYTLQRGTAAELEAAITSVDPPRASAVARDVATRRALRGDLDAILNRALKKRPQDRYLTAAALAQDLERHRRHEPVEARPDAWSYRIGRFIVRHRLQVGAAAVTGLALVAGAGVALWQAERARADAQRAEQAKRFVLSLLTDADVEAGETSADMRLSELLRRAQSRVDALDDQPGIAIELRTTIGLGLLPMAAAEGVKVLEVTVERARALGDDVRLASAQSALALALLSDGRVADARAPAEAAVAALQPRPGAEPHALITALNVLASERARVGDLDTALARSQDATTVARQHVAPRDELGWLRQQLTHAENLISAAHPSALDEARSAAEALDRSGVAGLEPLQVRARLAYADALTDAGRQAEAIAQFLAILPTAERVWGPQAVRVRSLRNSLLVAYDRGGDYAKAFEQAERVLALEGADATEGYPLGEAWIRLGIAHWRLRRAPEGVEAMQRGIALVEASLGPDGSRRLVRSSRLRLAEAMADAGRTADAWRVLDGLAADPQASAAETALVQARRARVWLVSGKPQTAVPLLETAEPALRAAGRAADADRAASDLAIALSHTDPVRAQPLLEQAAARWRSVQVVESPEQAEVAMAQARAARALGDVAAAKVAARQAAAFWSRFAPRAREAGEARAVLQTLGAPRD